MIDLENHFLLLLRRECSKATKWLIIRLRSSDQLPHHLLPHRTVNVYELSFGTVCGICAGVFLKKGARALAFIFGGVFVLLQYFNSLSLVRVDWQRAAGRFEKLFYSPPLEPGGKPRPPTVSSVWNWFVNFLTADFQQRASFIAGFALGLRIG
ncbi:hypothetical protein DL93DRAFT_2061194 [Clavulina sp. PMI_390]|nr:hypothetical protein DL93DRAFT_2061194 [Clavulina sp. PMI_390]